MKAYYGQHIATGTYYAQSELPPVTQWGSTADEAWSKLRHYLEQHYSLTLGAMEPFPAPEPEQRPERL